MYDDEEEINYFSYCERSLAREIKIESERKFRLGIYNLNTLESGLI